MAEKVAISDPVDSKHYDYKFKVTLIGDTLVGRTSLMRRFVDDQFGWDPLATVGVDLRIGNVSIGRDVIKLQMWDAGGQERYMTLPRMHIRESHGILLVYSIISRWTFDSLQDWLVDVKSWADPNAVIVLVGNMCDCESSREVTTQEASDFANRNEISFYETSAKESINVDTVFTKLLTEIYNKRDVLKIQRRNDHSLTIAPDEGSDRTAHFESHYKEALKNHGAVSVEILRALFVGPSGAGKSSLRHLLVHGKSKEMVTSTPVMETPDILVFGEHYIAVKGSSIWKPVSESCLNQSVKVCAAKKDYQKREQYPTAISNSLSGYPERGIFERVADAILQSVRIPQRRLQSEGSKCLEASRSEVVDSIMSKDSPIPLDKASFLHIIDSGGQPAFQDILPLLLAIPCTYIQVFDATKDLDEPIRSTYRPREGVKLPLSSNQPLETQWEFIQHSLSSMQTMAHKFARKDLEIFKGTCPEPRIIIAGTFKDEVLASGKSEEIVSSVEQRIKSLEGKPYFRHIQWPDSNVFFLVDNHMTIHSKGKGEGVDLAYLNKLRECISDKSGILKVDVPLMWLQLELVTRRSEKKFFTKDELKQFCLKNRYIDQRKADEQFLCLLKLLHVLGFYAYFDLDPQYLRGGVNYVCTDATALYREVSKLLAVQFTPSQSGATKQFQSTGIIPHHYESLLSELGVITDIDPVWFLEVLHHVGIAARLTPSRDPPSYFIPSCLPYGKAKVPTYSSVGPLCITFVFKQDSFTTYCDLPHSVFCRLVVELADREWNVILQESDRKSVKFSCPRPSTYVYLTEKPGHIQCQIVIDESAALSSLPDPLQEIHHHCSAIRARLEENLHHITQQVFGERFHEIAQILPVLPCSCQPDVPNTAPVNDGVATCFHCGSFPKLSPSHKVWFSPPDPSEAMVRVVRETGVAFWKLKEVSDEDELLGVRNPVSIPSSMERPHTGGKVECMGHLKQGPVTASVPQVEHQVLLPDTPPPGSSDHVTHPSHSSSSCHVTDPSYRAFRESAVVDFQSKLFLEKYKEAFLQVVDAHAIRMMLEIDGVISKKLSFDMDKTSSDEATELLYLHLRDYATSQGIHKLCDVMTSKTGYGNMIKLGDKMKSDKDLPPYTDMSGSPNGTTSQLDGASQTDLSDKCPSDVGVLGILKHIPQCYDLAVMLGVPIAQVNAYRSDPELGGGMSLLYWRNGRCEGAFPNTWGFLLETVDKLKGHLVAKQLRDEAEKDKTWSLS